MESEQVERRRSLGSQIVVLDRGWVYYSPRVEQEGDDLVLHDAKCIRRWGTTKGLGELVNGPTSETALDPAGLVVVPRRALIHMIACRVWS